jgi:hypothetical protein
MFTLAILAIVLLNTKWAHSQGFSNLTKNGDDSMTRMSTTAATTIGTRIVENSQKRIIQYCIIIIIIALSAQLVLFVDPVPGQHLL